MAELVTDLLWLATLTLGPIATVYGIWLIYGPAGWIVGGLIFFIARCGGIGPMIKLIMKTTEGTPRDRSQGVSESMMANIEARNDV